MAEDHPHACGDKLIMLNGSMAKLGSSPCVWGQGRKTICKSRDNRIIPMRVGTSINQAVNDYRNKDHPHACGDKRNIVLPLRPVIGSSPCVWGQVRLQQHLIFFVGIIPMRVGTRTRFRHWRWTAADHPHACGDKITLDTGATTKFRIIPMRVGTRCDYQIS